MDDNDIFNDFQKFLKETNGDFHILETQIPLEIQMEYLKNSNQLRKTTICLSDSDYEKYSAELYSPELEITEKKKILSILATSKQIKAFRLIEKYIQKPEIDLANWAYMALMESRISLESELSDEKQIYISTGLGGKGNKLRFYALLLSASEKKFLDYQKKIIEREFEFALSKADCNIEKIFVADEYVELILLVPIRIDIKELLLIIINECNQYGGFLSEVFTITNVKVLNEDEIMKILRNRNHGNN